VRCRVEGGTPIITDANLAFGNTFGPDEEAVEGKDLEALVAPDGRREAAAEIGHRALEEGPMRTEVRRTATDGPRHFRLQTAGRKPEDGPTEIYAVYTDITERKERERRLRQAETLFRSTKDALFLIDVEKSDADPGGAGSEEERWTFSVRRVNPAYEEQTGLSGTDLRGRSPRDIFGEKTGRALEKRYRECARRREATEYEREFSVGGESVRLKTQIVPVTVDGETQQIVGTTRDVTEERRRERELRRQKVLLEQAQQLVGAWEADLQTGEVSWSEKVYEIHEMDPSAEVSLEEALEFYTPESKEKLVEATEVLTEEGEPYDLELQIETAEGDRRWGRAVGAPAETKGTEMEGGEVTKMAGAFQDITERKEEERRRKQAIERVTDAIVEVDSEWRFTLVNDQAETLFGTSGEELLGRSLWEAFGELEGTRFEEVYRGVMETRELARIEEYYSGLEGWFDVQVYPNADGGLAFYFEEITERKEAEEELRHLKDFYEQVLNAMPIDLAIFGTEGRYEYVTPSAIGDPERREHVIGMTDVEYARMRGKNLEPARTRLETIRRVARTREMEQFEETIEDPNGNPRHFIRFVTPVVRDGSVTDVLGYGLEITQRKQVEVELREAKERAESSLAAKERFLATMSHEVRTPLNAVLGMAQLLARTDLTDNQRSYLQSIRFSGDTLLTLLNTVLDFAKLEAGEVELEKAAFDPVRLAHHVRDMLRSKAEESGLDFRIEADPGLPTSVVGDAARVGQILTNLVGNALKFTDDGSVVIHVEEGPDSTAPAGGPEEPTWITFRVEDTGIGIPPEQQEHVFGHFNQADADTGETREGTGLGLAIVQTLVDQMGGTIDLESTPGEGSVFVVRLPFATDGAESTWSGGAIPGAPADRGDTPSPDATVPSALPQVPSRGPTERGASPGGGRQRNEPGGGARPAGGVGRRGRRGGRWRGGPGAPGNGGA
jgi:PAS domain S-box/PAS domain S-box/PAS domain S-box